jgi:carboxyl-terminal processing protease
MDQQPTPEDTFQLVEPAPTPVQPAPRKPRQRRGPLFTAVLLTALVTFLVAGGLGAGVAILVYESSVPPASTTLSFDDTQAVRDRLAKVAEMRALLKDDFLEELTDEQLLDAMIAGMADNLGNPYTFYMSAEDYSLWNESLSGQYSGIGASVILNKDGYVQVTGVVADGPADKAGMMTGDLFLTVDGVDVTGIKDANSLASKVKGLEGTVVVIGIERPSTGEKRDLAITRAKIVSDPIRARMLTDDIGYIQIKEFSSGLDVEFRATVADLMKQGATRFVFDMRFNPGGSAQEVIGMLDFLLPYGELASIQGRQEGSPLKESWTSDSATGVPASMKYAILVNGYTASASELFAGCLRDFGKAHLIGTQTYGKGSGTITYELSDGSAVNITTFKYYLPSGYSIEGEGLPPDKVVELPSDVTDQSPEDLPFDKDTQLAAAIDYLVGAP